MLGEGGKYIQDCLEHNYIGVNFIKEVDLTSYPHHDENGWRQHMIANYLECNPEKSMGTARTSIGFLWTVCYGLKTGDIVLAPNGEGGYCVAEITGNYHYAPNQALPHRRQVQWLNITIPRQSMSKSLQNSTGSIGTCCVEFHEFQETATRSLLKAAETKEYIALHSYELKRTIENDHQLKEYFFQALSNSSWANYGYLVAFEINEDLMEEIARLNRAFGIGIIQLTPYADATKELFPARRNELDYYTIDKLCRINADYKSFIDKATRVLNAQKEFIEDVKGGLQKFCDKGFDSQEEVIEYCNKHHIPC